MAIEPVVQLPKKKLQFSRILKNRLLYTGKRFTRYGRWYYWRLIRTNASPEYLARGFAAGTFAGFFPFFGLQTVLGVLLAVPLRGHKLTAALGTWVSNPLTYIPLFWFNFRVGVWLLGAQMSFTTESMQSLEALLELKGEFVASFFIGCFVCGLIGSLCCYVIALTSIRSWRNRRARRLSSRVRRDRPKVSPPKLTTPR
ncbi:MAG: DUF2062 domain-containing protein [Cyanobacteriota bacterium]|nr:DUF2062 domain-containing protein [Cyanobacteriota bacterium]